MPEDALDYGRVNTPLEAASSTVHSHGGRDDVVAEVAGRVVDRARGMRELVRSEAAESERLRTLTTAIVDEMWACGLMSALNPAAAGGVEPSLPEMIETWIEMAWQEGSFGWIGIANLPSTFAAATTKQFISKSRLAG